MPSLPLPLKPMSRPDWLLVDVRPFDARSQTTLQRSADAVTATIRALDLDALTLVVHDFAMCDAPDVVAEQIRLFHRNRVGRRRAFQS